jgi:hypothetical protein
MLKQIYEFITAMLSSSMDAKETGAYTLEFMNEITPTGRVPGNRIGENRPEQVADIPFGFREKPVDGAPVSFHTVPFERAGYRLRRLAAGAVRIPVSAMRARGRGSGKLRLMRDSRERRWPSNDPGMCSPPLSVTGICTRAASLYSIRTER